MAPKKKTGRSKPKSQPSKTQTKKSAAAKPAAVTKEPASKKATKAPAAVGTRSSRRIAQVAPENFGLGSKTASNVPHPAVPASGVGNSGASTSPAQVATDGPTRAENTTEAPASAQDATNAPAPAQTLIDLAASALFDAVDDTPEDEPLFQSDPERITYGKEGTKAQLTGEIQVSASAESSRKRYAAKFFLQHEGDSDPVLVCDISSWRVDRSTGEWITQFLEADIGTKSEDDGDDFETWLCLQGAFTVDGTARVKVCKKQLQTAEQLLFIQTIAVHSQFRRRGLLSPILKLFRCMLRGKFQFDGVLLLIPSRPKGESGDMWGEKKDRDVEDALKKIYKKADGYKTLSAHAEVADNRFPIMGRQVE